LGDIQVAAAVAVVAFLLQMLPLEHDHQIKSLNVILLWLFLHLLYLHILKKQSPIKEKIHK
jgi:hypothetical protein